MKYFCEIVEGEREATMKSVDNYLEIAKESALTITYFNYIIYYFNLDICIPLYFKLFITVV